MAIFHNVVQGSTAWRKIRIGKPTASAFDRIVTPGGKPSTQSVGYANELLAEMLMGRPMEMVKTSWMQRGNDIEAEAVKFYELQEGVDTEGIGFVTNSAGTIGASPDRLVGDDGLLETKCPSPQVHVGYLLFASKGVDKAYMPQLQGQLYITERDYVDICAYSPEMPSVIIRVTRDDAFIKTLAGELDKFVTALAESRDNLIERFGPLPELPEEPAEYKEFITDEDVEKVIAAQRVSV